MAAREKIFKNASGAWLSKQLFFETAEDKSRVLYTLKPEDHRVGKSVYPSLRRLYMEMGDESEYHFAEAYFGGYPHWKRLLQSSWFLDYLTEMREELHARNAAIALEQIKKSASGGSFQASKYLLEQGWLPKGDVGRPSKERIKQEAQDLFRSSEDISSDLDRISQAIGTFNTFSVRSGQAE